MLSRQFSTKGKHVPFASVLLLAMTFIFAGGICSTCYGEAYTIGAYYFPGWKSDSEYWRDIKGMPGSRSPGKAWPEREPLLGYYPEEELWVAERHIEAASAYNISFFAYDWYWNGTKPYLNHALENFQKANNRKKMHFSLLWANHSVVPKKEEEFNSMIQFWIKNYFNDPQYLYIEGKPVVFIFSPKQLNDNALKFGKTTAYLFRSAREMAVKAGLKGIYFVACTSAYPPYIADLIPNNNYDAQSAYNYHNKGFDKEYTGKELPAINYMELIEGYKSNWFNILTKTSLPYFVPMSAGWNSRPWGSNTDHDNCDSTPESFRKMLEEAKFVMDKYPEKTKKIGMICAWNELGEGSYIEPTKKWKYRYLEEIKSVFSGKKGIK